MVSKTYILIINCREVRTVKKIKFLHFGDLHLDMPFTSLGDTGLQSSVRRQELKECFDRVIGLAQKENVDIILISGDLFEHSYIRKSTINHINDKFKQIEKIRVFIVPGNHDPLVVDSYYKTCEWSQNVTILGEHAPSVMLESAGACIHGAGFRSFYEKESLVSSVSSANGNFINILLIHGTVDLKLDSGNYNPMTCEELDALGMDYIALGHFHNRIEGIGARRNIYNPGSPEPLGFDEQGKHGVFVGTLTKAEGEREGHLEVRFVETGLREYKTLEVNVNGCSSEQQIVDRIALAIYRENAATDLFDVRLRGYLERHFTPDIGYIQRCFSDKVFFLKVRDETAIDFDIEEILKEPGLRGLFAQKLVSLMEEEGNGDKELYKKALYYGLQALENGEVHME